MAVQRITVGDIPAIIWGKDSPRVYLCVHGKMSSKEDFEGFARLAEQKGFQTLSFDLAQHGERSADAVRCDIWSGIRDLTLMADFAFARWTEVNLYACSLGAYFSLNAFPDRSFGRCLFQSPIVDMKYLVGQMMIWFNVTEERLAREKEIDTPVDPLRWDYYSYILSHPIEKWPFPTHILYGGRDSMQSEEVIRGFARRFGCAVTLSPDSEHPFMSAGDAAVVEQWLRDSL